MVDHIVHGSDIGMVQSGSALGFLQEVLAVCGVGLRARRGALHRHQPLQRGIFGDVNLSHAAGAQPPAHHEAAYERTGKAINDDRGRLDLICHRQTGARILQF